MIAERNWLDAQRGAKMYSKPSTLSQPCIFTGSIPRGIRAKEGQSQQEEGY